MINLGSAARPGRRAFRRNVRTGLLVKWHVKCVAFLILAAASVAHGQSDVPAPVRLPIRHADPWMVKAMLEGMQVNSPEISTIPGFRGFDLQNAVNAFFRNGRLVVNATDNSLWFFPNREGRR